MNQLSITIKHSNLRECHAMALERGLGLEIQSFAFPPFLQMSDWSDALRDYRYLLAGFPYPISLHGAFMDMAPGSPDPMFLEVTRQRTIQSMELAAELGADTVVFHANFIAAIRNDNYRDGWIERTVEFFIPVATLAQKMGISVVLENMWEFDPSLLRLVLEGVDSPHLTACLDVGHAHLFSKLPFHDWLDDLSQWITYIHMNNNYGEIDEHHALDEGILDFGKILPLLNQLPRKPRYVLEIDEVDELERSLSFFPTAPRRSVAHDKP
jgi:sugar phosphate isomerase/epimerase